MSHDIEAAWATMELAKIFRQDSLSYLGCQPGDNQLTILAGTDKRKVWPIADGLIKVEDFSNTRDYSIAVEYKRTNEGIHGVLTALGQSQAYLHKGFSASAIVIPERYDSHSRPGEHLAEIIQRTADNNPIYLFTYADPDVSNESPFAGKLRSFRNINLASFRQASSDRIEARVETQWGHMREGSSDSHSFFLYLKTAKELNEDRTEDFSLAIPQVLVDVLVSRGIQDPVKYLTNTVGDSYHDRVWRKFWLDNVCFPDMLIPWTHLGNEYVVNDVKSKLLKPDGGFKAFFSGKSNSIKDKIVERLNRQEIAEPDAAWEFVENVRSRAHSFREDIDSGLEALELIDSDGKPTGNGYKFVDACLRNGTSESGLPSIILSSLLLNNANYAAFLHYIYRVSEKVFSANPLSFSSRDGDRQIFKRDEYLNWLSDKLSNELLVMRKVTARGGQARKPFQAEFAILRRFGLVKNFRVGVGIEIDWPEVQKLSSYEL